MLSQLEHPKSAPALVHFDAFPDAPRRDGPPRSPLRLERHWREAQVLDEADWRPVLALPDHSTLSGEPKPCSWRGRLRAPCGGERACYVPVAVCGASLPRTPSATRCTDGASRFPEEPGLRPSPISLATAERRAAYFGATIG